MLFYLTGYVAYLLPAVLGVVAWIALFGMDSDGDGDADLGPALRLVGIVGFLVSATGLLALRFGNAIDFSAGSGGILGRLVGNSLYRGFGPVGGNLFLLALLLVSITLATGLSWLAVMDWIGKQVLALPARFRQKTQQAVEWHDAREMRVEREETRRVDSELRAKRAPVKIEPPAPPAVEKSDRAKREQQIPLFHVGDGSGIRRWRCSTIPSRRPRATTRTRWKRCRGRSNSSSRISASTRRWSAPIRAGDHPLRTGTGAGVKVSQISSLDKGHRARPLREIGARGRRDPGKSVVGLETPNTHREMIFFLSELLRSANTTSRPAR